MWINTCELANGKMICASVLTFRFRSALLAPSQDPEYGEHEQLKQRRMEEVDFIMSHPTYDVSLWLFSQQSRIRNFCQTLVTPPYGLRIFGEAPNSRRVTIFQLLIFVSIVASVVIAAVATPTYRQKYCKPTKACLPDHPQS